MRKYLIILAVLSLFFWVTPRQGYTDIFLDKAGKIKLYGNIRFRQESDFDSTQSDGTLRKNRNRTRNATKLGLRYQPIEPLLFNIRMRTGGLGGQKGQTVGAVTIVQNGFRETRGDFYIDKASLKYSLKDIWLRAGRDELPFWKQNEFLWSDNVYLDGFATGWIYPLNKDKKSSLAFNGGFFALPDGEDNHHFADKSKMGALQAVYKQKISKGDFTIAAGLLAISDKSEAVNSTNQDQDYALWSESLQYKFNVGQWPLALGSDFIYNGEDYPDTLYNRRERFGYVLHAVLGQLENPRDWLLGYYYARIEKYAIAFNFSEDDWVRWGTATQIRSSNLKGHEIRLGYALTKNASVVLRAFLVEGIKNETASAIAKEDGKRIRLDFSYKF